MSEVPLYENPYHTRSQSLKAYIRRIPKSYSSQGFPSSRWSRCSSWCAAPADPPAPAPHRHPGVLEREFYIDNLLVRIHYEGLPPLPLIAIALIAMRKGERSESP